MSIRRSHMFSMTFASARLLISMGSKVLTSVL